MRIPLRQLLLCMLGLVTGSGALAFSLLGNRWLEPTAKFYVGMPGTSPSGVSWSSALTSAMDKWNAQTQFKFVADAGFADPCSRTATGNRIDFRATACGNNFGNNVLAVTLTLANPGRLGFGELYQSNIIFNSSYSWDVYDGPRRSQIDFGRVALHELGHAIGLDHESSQPAIMAPTLTDLSTLQADDVAGVKAIYGGTGACLVRDVSANVARQESLGTGDCQVRDLFGGNDTSFVDVYRLRLAKTMTLDFAMSSSELDSVLILTNANMGNPEIFDDTNGQCDARFRKTLPAGEYRLLANTYVTPAKCVGNTGSYSLTISDSGMPVLGSIKNAIGGSSIANAVISGAATLDGSTYATSFTANETIDVLARIVPDPQHVGIHGRIYVVAVLDDGRQFMKSESGKFIPFGGGIENLIPLRTGTLAATESVSIASALQGAASGLAGHSIYVYVGYALSSSPWQVWYGATPISFSIAPW
jgi:hypothetical protein